VPPVLRYSTLARAKVEYRRVACLLIRCAQHAQLPVCGVLHHTQTVVSAGASCGSTQYKFMFKTVCVCVLEAECLQHRRSFGYELNIQTATHPVMKKKET
jgi:hypothetical protein